MSKRRVLHHTFSTADHAGRALGRLTGHYGKLGGWIYHPITNRITEHHGWGSFALANGVHFRQDDGGWTFPADVVAAANGENGNTPRYVRLSNLIRAHEAAKAS